MNYRYLCLLFMFSSHLFAYDLKELWYWYNNAEYDKVCSHKVAFNDYYNYNKDENFVNMYAYSCLKIDMLNRLAIPIIQLIRNQQSRSNATYFATILYQKKLLYQALIDGNDTTLPKDLPDTDYILSKIYNDFSNKRYTKKDANYIFQDNKDKNTTYKVFIRNDDGIMKIVLQTIQNDIVMKTRMYW